MYKLLPLLLLTSCAYLNNQPGVQSPTDIYCGSANNLKVYIRFGNDDLLTCQQAMKSTLESNSRLVTVVGGGLNPGWSIIFTNGFPGVTLNRNNDWVPTIGTTYPDTHVISVRASRPEALYHELLHAYELDRGISDGHRDWCKKYGECGYYGE